MIRQLCLSLLLLPALTALAEQDVINKSFEVKPGGTLSMNVDRGTIKILTANTDKVEIEVVRELKRASAEKAQEVYEQHKIDFNQDGDSIRIEADDKARLNPFKNIFNNLQVEYTITVPAKFDVDVRTRGGNIDIADLAGEVKAQTSGGSLNIGATSGAISVRTSGGNIKIAGSKSNVDAQTSGGSLTIGHIDGKLLAKTSGGNINLDHINGAIDAQTSGGSIKVTAANGPLKASTSGGNVSAELGDQASGECNLKTMGGSVKVLLPEKIAVDLEATTMGGRVNSDFDGEFNKQRTRLVAEINGGGPAMRLFTSGGNVEIRKK
jgi:DUF4097 and DUF4098 domain-containing protein YvlB